MTLAVSTVTRGRAAAEALMVDTCRISRPGAGTVFDPVTGEYVDDPGEVVYEGRCRVQVSDALRARESDVGGAVLTIERLELHIPVSVTGVEVDCRAVILTAAHDPDLVDKRLRVAGTHAKTHATSRRLHVEEVAL